MIRNLSVRTKIMSAFLIIAVSAACAGLISISIAQKTLESHVGEDSLVLARSAMNEIDREINNKLQLIQAYADDETVIDYLETVNREFDAMENAESYINRTDKEWISEQGELITPFMQKLISNRLSENIRKTIEKKEFYKHKHGHTIFSEIFLTNKYGANVAQTQKTSDYYQADEEWWIRSKSEDYYVGGLNYDESAGVYALDITASVRSKSGEFLGVIKAVFNIQEILTIIKEHEDVLNVQALRHEDEMFKKRRFKLLTADGRIIYSTEDFIMFEYVSDELLKHVAGSKKYEGRSFWVAAGDKPGEKDQLFSHVHSEGHDDFKGVGWTLLMEQNEEDIFATIHVTRRILLIIMVYLIFFSILIGWLVSSAIAGPITELKNATVEIGKGNLDKRVRIVSGDETGKLADSFNKMAARLKESSKSEKRLTEIEKEKKEELTGLKSDLEKQVAKRTAELQERIFELERYYNATTDRELRMKELRDKIEKLENRLSRKNKNV